MPTKKPAVTKPKATPIEDSIESILELLRGVGPVLVGSSPDPQTVQALLDGLKGPYTKEAK